MWRRLLVTGLAVVGGLAMAFAQGEEPPDVEEAQFIPQLDFENREQGDRVFSMAIISIPELDDFRCEIWCYEMADGVGEGQVRDDGSLVIEHTMGGISVTTTLAPEPGAVSFRVQASGGEPAAVRRFRSVNACWQLSASDAFGNRTDFFDDFVSRCFVYTPRGFTLMGETNRFPDTRWEKYQANPERNDPPWVQVYVPIWRPFPGQPEAFWGNSTDRPVHSLIGCVSRDEKWLTAWGWPRVGALSQGWHDCLHASPDFAGCYDEEANTLTCEGRLYFMANDPQALLERYLLDFPQEESPLTLAFEGGQLRVSHRDAPGDVEGPSLEVDSAEPNWWGGWTALSEGREVRTTWWLYPEGEIVHVAGLVENRGHVPFGLPDGFTREAAATGDAWARGSVFETQGAVQAGASTAIRGRLRMRQGLVQDMLGLLEQDEKDLARARPYDIPGHSQTRAVAGGETQ